MAIYDPIVDVFSQDQVNAPQINPNNFRFGGVEMPGDWARATERELRAQGSDAAKERQAAALGYGQQGQAGLGQMQGMAAGNQAQAATGLQGGADRAGQLGNQGNAMQANQQAQSAALQGTAASAQTRQAPTVDLSAANRSAQMGGQAQTGLMSSAGALGANAATLQNAARADAGQQNNIGALGRAAQTTQGQQQNAAALGAAGQTGAAQQGNAGAIRNFYQQGPGASQAEVQLRQGSEAAMASNLALARSGRGGANAGAERQALFANAAQQQNTNQSMALLRAKEADDFRNRQLQAMGLETGALGTARGQDIAGLSAQTQALGQARGQDIQALGTQGQMLGQARGQSLQALGQQTAALGQQASALQGAGGLANQQQQIGAQTALGVSGQQLQQGAQNDAFSTNMQGIAAQRAAAGDQSALTAAGLGNQAIGQGQQYALGQGGLANQAMATGLGYNTQQGALANQAAGQGYSTDLAYQGMGLNTIAQQANLNMQMEALRTGQGLQASMANAGFDRAQDAGILGGVVAGGAMLAASDVRAKSNIQPMGDEELRAPIAPYESIVEANRNQGAQVAAYDAAQSAQGGAAGAAGAKPPAEGMPLGQKLAIAQALSGAVGQGAEADIPIYQAPALTQGPAFQQSYDVTSDERAKEAEYQRGQTDAKLNIAAVARSMDPQRFQGWLQGEAVENMRRYGVPGIKESKPGDKPKPAAKPKPKPATQSDEVAALSSGGTDLRSVSNSRFQYKDPSMPGALPGRQVGPMAQDILRSDAAPIVRRQPNGMLGVDGARAGMVALGAQGEQQRRIDALEEELAALGVHRAA